MSTFDPAVMESTVYEQDSETRFTPIPSGEYRAYTGDELKWREYEDRPICAIDLKIMDAPELAEQLNMETPSIEYGMFLDTEGDGRLSFGANKNVKLGQLREALGQNHRGTPWSFSMLTGQGPLKIRIEPDKKDPEKYSRVVAITRAES